jgi:hypothetical protein
MNTLDETTRSYGKAIRWNYFELANSFRKEPDRSTHETDFSALKKLRVTSYEVLSRNLSENHRQAGQTVKINFYRMSDMIEKTIIDRQDWQYDINDKKWYLHSSMPDFGQNN